MEEVEGRMDDLLSARQQGLKVAPAERWVYGVTTTGIYCRPGCPSRLPRPEKVRFFADADAARTAGFRACKRCGGAAGSGGGASA